MFISETSSLTCPLPPTFSSFLFRYLLYFPFFLFFLFLPLISATFVRAVSSSRFKIRFELPNFFPPFQGEDSSSSRLTSFSSSLFFFFFQMSDRKRFLFKFQRRTGLVSSQISKVSAHEQNESGIRFHCSSMIVIRYSGRRFGTGAKSNGFPGETLEARSVLLARRGAWPARAEKWRLRRATCSARQIRGGLSDVKVAGGRSTVNYAQFS